MLRSGSSAGLIALPSTLEVCTGSQRNPENRRGKYLESVPSRGPPIRLPLSEDPSSCRGVQTVAARSPRHRAQRRTGGAVNPPLTDWEDHRSRPCPDTVLQREAVTVSLTPVTASCCPDMRWAARAALQQVIFSMGRATHSRMPSGVALRSLGPISDYGTLFARNLRAVSSSSALSCCSSSGLTAAVCVFGCTMVGLSLSASLGYPSVGPAPRL